VTETRIETQVDPGDVRMRPDELRPEKPRHRWEHAHHAGKRRRSQRLLLAIALVVTVAVLFAVSIFSIIRISSLASRNSSLRTELSEVKLQLANTDPSRPPYLKELTPDKVMALGGYVKDIVFTVQHQNGGTQYDYRLTMENKSGSTLRPDVRVFIFDHKGMPIGVADMPDHTDLASGQSRAAMAAIDRFIDEEPRYFYVSTRDQQKAGVESK